jgi:hypothetical protein
LSGWDARIDRIAWILARESPRAWWGFGWSVSLPE